MMQFAFILIPHNIFLFNIVSSLFSFSQLLSYSIGNTEVIALFLKGVRIVSYRVIMSIHDPGTEM